MEEQIDQIEYKEPRNEVERKLADIVQEVLRTEKVSIHSNFFDLGATSIDIIVIHNNLEEAYQRDFNILLIFEHPTISSLAKYLLDEDEEVDLTTSTLDQARAHKTARQRRRQFREALERE